MDFTISVDLSPVMAATRNVINAQVLPLLRQAVIAVAQQVQIDWIKGIHAAPHLWVGEKDEYAASVDMKATGDFSALVWSDYGQAEGIETGRPGRDLKAMLNTSAKVRVSAKGRRYLIIPFRHNVPGSDAVGRAMPKNVYAEARQLKASTVAMAAGMRQSGLMASDVKTKQRMMVPTNTYTWGGHLPAGLAPKLKPSHKTDIYAGMVRFDTSTPGGNRHSSHMTFRVMVDGSPGWVTKPQPGLNIVRTVVENMRPLAEKAFAEALNRSF